MFRNPCPVSPLLHNFANTVKIASKSAKVTQNLESPKCPLLEGEGTSWDEEVQTYLNPNPKTRRILTLYCTTIPRASREELVGTLKDQPRCLSKLINVIYPLLLKKVGYRHFGQFQLPSSKMNSQYQRIDSIKD